MAKTDSQIKWLRPSQLITFGLLLLLAIFVWWPIGSILKSTITTEAGFGFDHYRFALQSNSLWSPFKNSLYLGVTVGVLATLVGFILAYFTSFYRLPGAFLIRGLTYLSMVSPPFMLAIALIMLFGKQGILTQSFLLPLFNWAPEIYGFYGLVLIETLAYFCTSYLLLSSTFSSIDPILLEASYSQGASRMKTFWKVIFPLSLPSLFTSFLLIFIESLADFGNPLILSGNFKVLSVESYLKITGEYDTAGGSVLALALLLPCLLAYVIQKWVVSKKSFVTLTGKPSPSPRPQLKGLALVMASGLVVFTCLPILSLYSTVLFGAFVKTWGAGHEFTLLHIVNSLRETREAFLDSFLISGISAPISLVLGFIAALILLRSKASGKQLIEASSLLTFAVPGTVIGIGYILAFNDHPLLLTGTLWIIVALLAFRNLPLALQSVKNNLLQIDPSMEEGARSLGAGPTRVFAQIVTPLVAPGLISGFSYAFVKSITAISAIIFVVSGSWNLITVNILGFVETSHLSKASAICVVLMTLITVLLTSTQIFMPKERR
ncbi:MAG: iron ABC transporter permease [Oligoflexia bacterium]|nr:iron ABC transporter permease [Oligoflexia bacterium]